MNSAPTSCSFFEEVLRREQKENRIQDSNQFKSSLNPVNFNDYYKGSMVLRKAYFYPDLYIFQRKKLK